MAAKVMHIAAAAALASSAVPAAAQAVNDDMRCLLASNAFSRAEKDPAKLQLAKAAMAFYLGRVNARMGAEEMRNALPVQAKTMTAAALGPAMNACAGRYLQVVKTIGTAPPKGK